MVGKERLPYLHTQYGWGLLALVGLVTTFVLAMLFHAGLYPLALVVGIILTVALLSFGALTVSVNSEELRLRFGIGLIRKRIPLNQIRGYQVVQNKWWYGWGIRITPHGTLWNVSGLGAVELLLDGPKKFRIGTDEPEVLQRALERLAGKPRPIRPEDEAIAEGRAKRVWIVVLGIAALILIGVGGLLWAESRPPKSSVDAQGLHVASAAYSADVPLEAMTEVALLQRLPRILARTNGTGLGRTLRGHFRVDQLGDGQLFLEAGHPPYLLVKTHDSFVIVGYEDPARTLTLHKLLQDLRAP